VPVRGHARLGGLVGAAVAFVAGALLMRRSGA
jgi:hypothetical protein